MYTIDEIKIEAAKAADTFEFNWEKLEDPTEREFLETRLNSGMSIVPTVESLYMKLISGKNLVLPDVDTALEPEEVAIYTMFVAEELYSAYILQSIKDRYDKVNNIIALSGSME